MKNLAIATLLTITCVANASTSVKFVPVTETLETQLCVTAAKEGLSEAKKFAVVTNNLQATEFFSTVCNGMSISDFANKFEVKPVTQQTNVVYKFKKADDSFATRVCAIAAQNGYQAAKEYANTNVELISCNGESLQRFARKYAAR